MPTPLMFSAAPAAIATVVSISLSLFQFIGHFWEGRKPAFVDDISGLIVGPLFVVAEALFGLGLLPALRAKVEASAGPVRRRQVQGLA